MTEWLESVAAYLQEHAIDWLTSAAIGLVVLIVGMILARLAASATRRSLTRTSARGLAPMASTMVRISVVTLAVVMAADQVGFDVTTVLAGAGVLGLAIGFGAQTLVKDCISGLFMVLEDVVAEGDWVDMDGKLGQIEDVGLRITRLRSFDGTLWHIPNGEVKVVGNLNRGWARAVVAVGIAYEADLARGLEVLQSVAEEFIAENPDLVALDERPLAQGVTGLDDSSVGLRLVVRIKHTSAGELWPTERELRRRIKDAFDREGVEIPFPRRVVYTRGEQAA